MVREKLIFSIFGGTGNLTYNKLMPAFYQLYEEGKMNPQMSIVAIGRRKKTTEQFRDEVKGYVMKKSSNYKESVYELFKEVIFYFEMDFEDEGQYSNYEAYIRKLNEERGSNGNYVFYLATAPTFFPIISENLKASRILDHEGFKRAVFEKPFGYNFESALEINERITKIFGEENIYRIDHYLGKEMIQNILLVRFTNQIFKTVWNREAIDNIQITVNESVGVEERGGYYDTSGALRDMVQNHLFQILSLVAMEQPEHFTPSDIRKNKVQVLKKVKINPEDIVYAQYEGYRQEDRVNPESTTDTFVAMKCEIDTPRWKGVPFFLRTGKYLNSREAEVIIEFINDPCCCEMGLTTLPNLLVIKIQPEEGIYFRINTKRPRTEKTLMPVSMDYCQSCNIVYRSPEAYERLLNDIIVGDSTLFTGWDEVETAWTLIGQLSENRPNKLVEYKRGSYGPKEADDLLKKFGRRWWLLEDITNAKFNT